MATVTAMRRRWSRERGFSLIESLLALGILSGGLLALALALATGVKKLADAPIDLVAKQKATEAIEAVFQARDTQLITWSQIRNIQGGSGADGGIFMDGPQLVRVSGADGLVNTADDGDVETVILPGNDGVMGTRDDQSVPLSQYTREIQIRDISPVLRRIDVTVTYRTGNGTRRYELTTYVSSYS
jgi:prepilin-type N-terminal cleavage/methylation domain-containing protein